MIRSNSGSNQSAASHNLLSGSRQRVRLDAAPSSTPRSRRLLQVEARDAIEDRQVRAQGGVPRKRPGARASPLDEGAGQVELHQHTEQRIGYRSRLPRVHINSSVTADLSAPARATTTGQPRAMASSGPNPKPS